MAVGLGGDGARTAGVRRREVAAAGDGGRGVEGRGGGGVAGDHLPAVGFDLDGGGKSSKRRRKLNGFGWFLYGPSFGAVGAKMIRRNTIN